MSVCIDCRYLGQAPSGIGELTQALVNYVPDLAPEIQFILLRNPKRKEPLSKAENVAEIEVKNPANGPATLWWLPQVVDFTNVGLFHAPFNILPAGLKMRTLATVHDIMWITHPKWCNLNWYGAIERRFYGHGIRRAFNHADCIATVSNATRSAILELRPDLEDRIHVTMSGVSDTFRKVEVNPQALASIGLDPGGTFILTAGQSSPYKNHEGAIRAFAHAFADREDIALVMVQRRNAGAGALVKLAHDLGVGGRVHFTGAVDQSLLLQLYSGATALLHPSLCEGFGNPVAEAMACGCPVITSNVSAMPEVAGGAALLANPWDVADMAKALTRLVDDKALASQLSAAGLERAKQLSWKSFAQKNVEIYRRLLSSA